MYFEDVVRQVPSEALLQGMQCTAQLFTDENKKPLSMLVEDQSPLPSESGIPQSPPVESKYDFELSVDA